MNKKKKRNIEFAVPPGTKMSGGIFMSGKSISASERKTIAHMEPFAGERFRLILFSGSVILIL